MNDNELFNSIQQLIRAISFMLVFLVISFIVIALKNIEENEKQVENLPFCSVESIPSKYDSEEDFELFEKGKILFRENCASCHNKNMKDDLTGPSLLGVRNRWNNYPPEDLYNWIRNSQKMIESKHPKALELWDIWKPALMNDFEQLNNDDIEAILSYIEAF